MPTSEQEKVLQRYREFRQQQSGQASTGNFDPAEEAVHERYLRFQQQQFREEESLRERAAGGAIRTAPLERSPVGALVGGIAPFLLPGGALGQAARFGLSIPGAAIGELGQQGIEALTGLPTPRTVGERAEAVGRETLMQGAGGLTGEAANVVRMLPSQLRRPLTTGGARAEQFGIAGAPFRGQPLMPSGARLTPAQLTEAPSLEILQNLAEGSLLGSPILEGFRTQGQRAVDQTARLFADKLGQQLSPPQLGDAIVGAIQGHKESHRIPAKAIYNALDELTAPTERLVPQQKTVVSSITDPKTGQPYTSTVTEMVRIQVNPVPVATQSLKDFITPLKQVAKEINNIGGELGGDTLVEMVATLPETLTYTAAKTLRSRLTSLSDQIEGVSKKAPALGVIKQLTNRLDTAIDSGLGTFNPHLRDTWRQANAIWRGTAERYDNDLIKGLVKAAERYHGGTPERVFDMVWRRGAESDLLRLKKALGETSTEWASFKRQAVETLFDRAGLSTETSLIGKKLEDELAKMGDGALKAAFKPNELTWLREFANLAEQQQKTPQSGIGRMLIQMKQANIILNAAASGGAFAKFGLFDPLTQTIILGPAILAKLSASPVGRSLLVRGGRMPVSHPRAGEVIGRLAATLAETGQPILTGEPASTTPPPGAAVRPFPLVR